MPIPFRRSYGRRAHRLVACRAFSQLAPAEAWADQSVGAYAREGLGAPRRSRAKTLVPSPPFVAAPTAKLRASAAGPDTIHGLTRPLQPIPHHKQQRCAPLAWWQ